MSNKVIRLGGSHIGDTLSIQNLNIYLAANKGKNFVVVSAIPEILTLIEESIENVFSGKLDIINLQHKLENFYTDLAGGQICSEYQELVEQFANLLRGIALIGDYSQSLRDQFISFAERFTVEVLKAQWATIGKDTAVLWPEEIGLLANGDFGAATLISLAAERVNDLENGIYLVPGSYGITENGKIARTGKTGADYTAAFLVSELECEKLELWDLDNDFQRAKPEIVENPPLIQRLTYDEASELAYFEHYSFHPRTVEPLEPKHIPIEVISSASDKGDIKTTINTETFVEEQIVKSVACTDDISLLKLDGPGVGLKPGILAKTTGALNDAGINIKSVITSQTSINFVLEKEKAKTALTQITKLGFTSVKEISVLDDVALIGIVGHGMQHNYGVSARIFSAVANSKINVLLSGSGASDLVSYLVVSSADKDRSVREIYKAFF